MPTCSDCGETKPDIKFPKHGTGRWHRCRACGTKTWERNKRAQGIDPQEYRRVIAKRESRPAHERVMSVSQKRREHYDHQLVIGNGLCHICKNPSTTKTRRGVHSLGDGISPLHRDHDHLTGSWRGRLCAHCNLLLGCFKESLRSLHSAILYLQKEPGDPYTKNSRVPVSVRACEICGVQAPFPGRYSRLHVDHCHTRMRIRGYICVNCNRGLGVAKDSTAIIASAIEYLVLWGRKEEDIVPTGTIDYSWRNTPYKKDE